MMKAMSNFLYKIVSVKAGSCIAFLLPFFLSAQEVECDLTGNPKVISQYRLLSNTNKFSFHSSANILSLPFRDDFSKETIYPDTSLWMDKCAFINRDYPICPPTLGVATLDGVGPTGEPYDILAGSNSSSKADTMTSKPINLNLLVSDSIYLSFYYQAKGRGNDPESSDTLLVDFYNPIDSIWKNIWYKQGYNPTTLDSSFHLVMIPITDTNFLKNGFQFRFRNYATISGNVDHWHIDYVFLDKQRSLSDSIFEDVAFVYSSRSLLINYSAMPWEQYNASEMKTSFSNFIRNNDTSLLVPKNTLYKDTIFNESGGVETFYNGGSQNIYPYDSIGYCSIAGFNNHTLSYSFPSLTNSTSFLLECVLNTTPDEDRWNDTLRHTQKFHNYYSYDDGTVESGYGLNVAGGQIAYKFTLNNPDTLVAVQMLFNWMVKNVSTYKFRINVWDDDGVSGMPGTLLHQSGDFTPEYEYMNQSGWGNLTNEFHNYVLPSEVYLPSGTFYVGWVQFTAETLNVGMDKNIDSRSKIYWNTSGSWSQTGLPFGFSLMIRPAFRDTNKIASVSNSPIREDAISVYPNPTNGKFRIQYDYNPNSKTFDEKTLITVFDISGQIVYETTLLSYSSEVDISNLINGLYFLRIKDTRGLMLNKKIILTK